MCMLQMSPKVHTQQKQQQQQQPTLIEYARQQNIPLQQLTAANPTMDPNAPIQYGQQIIVPTQRAETVQQIADRLHVPVEQLIAANPGFTATRLIPAGQRVIIPAPQPQYQQQYAQYQQQQYSSNFVQSPVISGVYRDPNMFRGVQQQDADVSMNESILEPTDANGKKVDASAFPLSVFVAQRPGDLEDVASDLAFITSADELKALNPSFKATNGIVNADDCVVFNCSKLPTYNTFEPFETQKCTESQPRDTLETIAKRFLVPQKQILLLNPSLVYDEELPPGTSVILPRDTQPPRARRFQLEGGSSSVLTHECRAGDTIHSIAHRYGVQPETILAQMPSVKDPFEPLRAGQQVLVQLKDRNSRTTGPSSAEQYVTQWLGKNETEADVAKLYRLSDYGITAAELQPEVAPDGTRFVRVPLPLNNAHYLTTRPQLGRSGTIHVVGQKDTLENIAFRYGVPMEQIRRDNGLNNLDGKSRLAAGRRLVIQTSDPSRDPDCHHDPPVGDELTITTVGEETVQEIADRYGVTPDSIYEHNPHIGEQRSVPSKTALKIVVPRGGRPCAHLLTRSVEVIEAASGDTLASIAFRYGIPMDQIRHNNPTLSEIRPLPAGTSVVLTAPHVDPFTGATSCILGPNDTLAVIADRYGATREAIKAANPHATFVRGEAIRIPACSANPNYHQVGVERDETLAMFAARHPYCPIERIIALNPHLSNPNAVVYDPTLLMPAPSEAAQLQLPENQLQPIKYAINTKAGRSLQGFSELYNVPIKDLMRLNPQYLAYGVVPKGGVVILPQTVETRENPLDLLRHLHLTKPAVFEVIPYTTRDGEGIQTICKKFGCEEARLRAVNKRFIKDGDKIIRGSRQLYVPIGDHQSKVFDGEGREAYAQRVLSDPNYYRRMHKALNSNTAGGDEGLVDDRSPEDDQLMAMDPTADPSGYAAALKRKEREAYQRAKAAERSYREELERGRALEELGIVTRAGDDGDFAEMLLSGQPGEGNLVGKNTFDRVQLEPFLNFKNDKYRQMLMQMKEIEDERDALAAENQTLRQDLVEAGYLQASRAKLVKALYEMYKAAKRCAQLTDHLGIQVQTSPQTRESLLNGLFGIEEAIQTFLNGHRVAIVNYMTDAEVYHLGISPNLILDELKAPFVSRLLLTAPSQRTSATASIARGKSPTATRTVKAAGSPSAVRRL
eukprot:GILJ01016393.1.p1 GENE.GILJ01016393.1~~GILJ01016393.1.p1  ORF type:complete len:1186 (-),score=209.63 GILJ01016393.1:127-3684(-)